MNNRAGAASFLKHHKIPLLALLLLPVLANVPALFLFDNNPAWPFSGLLLGARSGIFPGPMDWVDPTVGFITEPLGHLAAADWLHGVIPWWNPYSGVGMPLAAEMQTSAFFLPFVLLLKFSAGWLLLRVTLQLLCGIFAYLLFAELGLARSASCLGAALYALSPEFFLSPHAAIAPLPFLPLLLLGIERTAAAAREARPMGWALVSLATAYSIYAGFPEVAFFDGLLAAFWAAWRFASLPGTRAKTRFSAKLCLGVAIAIALAAPLLVPFLEYLPLGYIGAHNGAFSRLTLAAPVIPLQIFPYLFGVPAAFHAHSAVDWTRLPGWADLPLLALALAAFSRRGAHPGLRLTLLAWIVLWEARDTGFPPAIWLVNLVPGIATADSMRFSGPAVNFAVFALAALAFDDFRRSPGLSRRRLLGMLLVLAMLAIAAVAPALGFLHGWYAAYPHARFIALVTTTAAVALLAVLCAELRRPRHYRRLIAVLLIFPACMFVLPQFAGLAAGRLDMTPIRFLQANLGTGRMISLGPMGANFPARYDIASMTYNALPVPSLWVDEILAYLFPQADFVSYPGDVDAQISALVTHLPAYEALGVRYAVADPSTEFNGTAVALAPGASRNRVFVLRPGGPDYSGSATLRLPYHAIGAASFFAGTYLGSASGPVTLRLCAGGTCVAATEDAATAADNAPMYFEFAKPLPVSGETKLTYEVTHPSGTRLAIWLATTADGTAPALSFYAPARGVAFRRVFTDGKTAIFELPAPAAYATALDSGCKLAILSRQHMTSDCPKNSILIRRELFFPGWRATVNGAGAPVAQSGIFEAIALPAGAADIRFRYAPPHIRAACLAAILAGLLWAGCAAAARGRGGKRIFFF